MSPDHETSMREKIRQASRESEGLCRNREIKSIVKARWNVEPTDSEIWNVLGNERSRVFSKIGFEQRRKAEEFLQSVFWDVTTAKQLLDLVRLDPET